LDAPRRLFYVAMTRARATLTIMTDGQHPFAHHGDEAILARRVMADTAILQRAQLRYVSPDPKLVDLSFPGRLADGHPSLAGIDAAGPGNAVQLVRDGNRWHIEDNQGRILSRLSRAFAPPADTIFLRGQVAAVLNWRREDGNEEYAHLLRRDAWGVVLPELVFERAG
jgi:ATP-dependent DNA helicase RecQ